MSKKVIIVESDASLAASMQQALYLQGYEVESTQDGKSGVELIRHLQPQLAVLAVKLPAGQSGYIICKNVKKEPAFQNTKVLIVGNPEGFSDHKKLRIRADDYLATPFDADTFLYVVQSLIGKASASKTAPLALMSDSEMLSDSELISDMDSVDEPLADDDFHEIEAAPSIAPPSRYSPSTSSSSLTPPPAYSPSTSSSSLTPPPASSSSKSGVTLWPSTDQPGGGLLLESEKAELLSLRATTAELQDSLNEVQTSKAELQEKIRGLEETLENTLTDLETARAGISTDNKDKEIFSLRNTIHQRDKELLQLKSTLHERERETIDLRGKINLVEQNISELNDDSTRKDAQLKTLGLRAEQLGTERKRLEQNLSSSKDEARQNAARLMTLQSEYQQLSGELAGTRAELDTLRAVKAELDEELSVFKTNSSREVKGLRADLSSLARDLDNEKNRVSTLSKSLEDAQAQNERERMQAADEKAAMEQKVLGLEDTQRRQNERLGRLYDRIRSDEQTRERTRKALAIAAQLLDEKTTPEPESDLKEKA
ncbi:MAG: response regulator [Proteobacteria bacterium]|nr:response regulator [Cystobacterineae bacterium]MCL2259480.1 response regulator [Cystobacterineae bacterium]MCL2315319.1 response regulator [Pseudomonadota bacterium]